MNRGNMFVLRTDCICDEVNDFENCESCNHDYHCGAHATCKKIKVLGDVPQFTKLSKAVTEDLNVLTKSLEVIKKFWCDYWLVQGKSNTYYLYPVYVNSEEDSDLDHWWEEPDSGFLGTTNIFNEFGSRQFFLFTKLPAPLEDIKYDLRKSVGRFTDKDYFWISDEPWGNSEYSPILLSWQQLRHDSYTNYQRLHMLWKRQIIGVTIPWSEVRADIAGIWLKAGLEFYSPDLFKDWPVEKLSAGITQYISTYPKEFNGYEMSIKNLSLPHQTDSNLIMQLIKLVFEFVDEVGEFIRYKRKLATTGHEIPFRTFAQQIQASHVNAARVLELANDLELSLDSPMANERFEIAWWPKIDKFHFDIRLDEFDPSYGAAIENRRNIHLFESSENLRKIVWSKVDTDAFLQRLASQDSNCLDPEKKSKSCPGSEYYWLSNRPFFDYVNWDDWMD